MSDRKAWHDLLRELPIDPARPIVDAHHHLWRAEEGPHPGPAYLHPQLLEDIAGRNVIGSVYVESSVGYRSDGPDELRAVGETEFAAAQAAIAARTKSPIVGIIAGADLRLRDRLDTVLAAHKAAGAGLFRGIRQRHDRSGPAYSPLSDPSVGPAMAALVRHGCTFDAIAPFNRLGDVAQFARNSPDVQIILQHLGLPLVSGAYGPRDEVLALWRDGIGRVAECPNVSCKLGGIGMDSQFGMGWSSRPEPPGSDEVAAWWRDIVCFCIDTFGPERCMFESNFPVDGEGLGYGVMWNAFVKIAMRYSDSERDDLFAGTAIRTYRLQCRRP